MGLTAFDSCPIIQKMHPILTHFSADTVSFPIIGTAYCGNTGFQSPADDYMEERIDLAKELVTNLPNIYCWRLQGESFSELGIKSGGIGVFDYSLKPQMGSIVLVRLHDVMTMKIVKRREGKFYLFSASPGYPVIPIDEEEGVQVFGVLRHYVISFDYVRAR